MSEYELFYTAVKTAAGSVKVAYPNVSFDDVTEYYQVFLLPGQKIGLGISYNSSDRQRGICQVNCKVRDGLGEIVAVNLANTIIDAFPKGTELTDTITVEIYDPAWKSPGLGVDGWYMIPVNIPYNIIT